MGWRLVTKATTEFVTIGEIKEFLKIDGNDSNAFLTARIPAAIDMCEQYMQLAIREQTWDYWMDKTPHRMHDQPWWNGVMQGCYGHIFGGSGAFIQLTKVPFYEVSFFKSYDDDDDATVFTEFYTDAISKPARLILNANQSWPSDGVRNYQSYQIRVVIGYHDLTLVPASIKDAVLAQMLFFFDHRDEGELKMSPDAKVLLDLYKTGFI